MDRIGSMADCSLGRVPGSAAVAAFTVTWTIAMIHIAVITDRFPSVGTSRSITFMRTRRETGKVTRAMLGMMGDANAAPDRKVMAEADIVVVADMAAAAADLIGDEAKLRRRFRLYSLVRKIICCRPELIASGAAATGV